ncbi:MAG: MFS transporter [Cyanobacteria bacterium P01_G01_bin.54]
MQTFLILWFGQLVSAIGSQMTLFALTVWAWEQTGSATTLALIGFFALLSGMVATPLVGHWVDRYPRKRLMLIGDSAIALAVLSIFWLSQTQQLQLWHLYAAALWIGPLSQLQGLAYQASLTTLLPKKHYTRASSLGMMIFYGSQILAPAFAGTLYPSLGLTGIMAIDLGTFCIALVTLCVVRIPTPSADSTANEPSKAHLWHSLTTGIRYICDRPALIRLLSITTTFWFFHELADTVVSPMILAQTNNNTTVLGTVSSAMGLGGVLGTLAITIWDGTQRREQDLALGMMGVGLSRIAFGWGRSPAVWLITQFLASLQFPLFGSAEQALWLATVEPQLQGRVFALQRLSQQGAIALAMLIAGPLADHVFEPALATDGFGVVLLGQYFQPGPGAGTRFLITLCAGCMALVGLLALRLPALQQLESDGHKSELGS